MEHYEDVPGKTAASQFDRAALESSLKESQPYEEGRVGDALGAREPVETSERRIIGAPERAAQYCHLQTGDTCATVAQEGVIQKHTGIDYGEKALAEEAYEKGWTESEGRTYTDCVGNLLDAHGIPTRRSLDSSATLDDIRDELSQNHDAIVGVDAGELYRDSRYLDVGHTVWVTGLETDTSGQVTRVFINDGNPPPQKVYDVRRFQKAWDAGGRLMVSTRHAAFPG